MPMNLPPSNPTPAATAALFAFGDERVRVILDAQGEPWFVAADVCRALGIGGASQAVHGNASRSEPGLDEDQKGVCNVATHGGDQNVCIVNESGLYALVFKSRKPEARAFRRWITKEVIPSIRRTGGYVVKDEVGSPAVPMSYKDALKALVAEIEAREVLALENAELRPKAEFFDAVASSDDTLGMIEAAKLLGLGRNRMMAALRKAEVFRRNNTPFQQYIDAGYFKVVEGTWADSKGDIHVTLSTRVYQRGLDFLRRKVGCPTGAITKPADSKS